jgi:hypothetical protein
LHEEAARPCQKGISVSQPRPNLDSLITSAQVVIALKHFLWEHYYTVRQLQSGLLIH